MRGRVKAAEVYPSGRVTKAPLCAGFFFCWNQPSFLPPTVPGHTPARRPTTAASILCANLSPG